MTEEREHAILFAATLQHRRLLCIAALALS